MKDLNVSMKLFIGFGVAVALSLILGVISIFELGRLNEDYRDAIDVYGKPLKDAGGFLEAIQALRSETRGVILFTGNNTLLLGAEAAMDNWCARFEAGAAEYGKSIVDSSAKELFSEALEKYETVLKPSMYAIVKSAKTGVPTSVLMDMMLSTTSPASDFVADAMRKTMEIKTDMLDKSEEKGTALYNYGLSIMITLPVLSALISIILGLYISAQISKPLKATVGMITEMGKGHLSDRLDLNRKDEIGVMAKAMDKFAEDLQVTVIGTLNRIANGELTMKISTNDHKDELGASLRRVLRSLRELIIDDGGSVLQCAARKDLSRRMTGVYRGGFARIKNDINAVMENLDGALEHVAEVVDSVSNESDEISTGAWNLAASSGEQADALSYVSSNLEEMSETAKRNADHAGIAKVIVSEAHAAVDEGDLAMRKLGESINNMKLAAENTAKIVKTINDISFQMGVAAVNAAVEADCAGDAGKGFVKVAQDVRALAVRSTEAAKEIAATVVDSMVIADDGVKFTERAAASLAKIVKSTGKTGVLIDGIAAASSEHAREIERVNETVERMSKTAKLSAARAEESALAVERLNCGALELENLVVNFTLSASSAPQSSVTVEKRQQHAGHHGNKTDRQKHQPHQPHIRSVRAMQAKELIPADEEELAIF